MEPLFEHVFGAEPSIRTRSPGRINLIGGHVDYLGGSVLPIAIERHLDIAALPIGGHQAEVISRIDGKILRGSFDVRRPEPHPEPWLNYVIGVVAGYVERGIEVPAFRAAIESTIPAGAGLSSSAALETATAVMVEQLTGERLDGLERAKLCQRAEHLFARVPCGIMDQLAVGVARADHVLRLDCRTLALEWIPLPSGITVVVADTGVHHELAGSEYRKRRETCEAAARTLGLDSLRDATLEHLQDLDGIANKRVRHAITEMERVDQFCQALSVGDLAALGPLMQGSHHSLRDDFEVSCLELDNLVAAAEGFGPKCIGSRMTGGGFGGSTVSLVRTGAESEFMQLLADAHRTLTQASLLCFTTSATGGALQTQP